MLKKLIYIILLLLVVAAGVGFFFYNKILGPNLEVANEHQYLYLPSQVSYPDLLDSLASKFVKDTASFNWVAKKMNYGPSKIKPGKYDLKGITNNYELVSKLRSGQQTPVNVIVPSARTNAQLAGQVAKYIEVDSQSLVAYLSDSEVLKIFNLSEKNILASIIPNTYQFFWNTDAKGFLSRMIKERDKFWTDEKEELAKKINLTREEVFTLASIVEQETQKNDEKPTVAGVYLNRLSRDMPLQADPTIIFAWQDYSIRRVLNKHLAIRSPYNTYLNNGLPPGPISMASISSVNAVLQAKKHKYLYFCAKPDLSGYHAFAKTLQGHNVNAKKYQRWLNKNRIGLKN